MAEPYQRLENKIRVITEYNEKSVKVNKILDGCGHDTAASASRRHPITEYLLSPNSIAADY